MNAQWKRHLSWFVIVLLAALGACQPATDETNGGAAEPAAEEPVEEAAEDSAEDPDEGDASLANPAAVYCEGLGHEMEARATAAGADAACVFPDGSECGQWDFLAGRCGQEQSYCQQQGGVLQAGEGNIGTCVFADGSSCLEMEFFEGTCVPGDQPGEMETEATAAPEGGAGDPAGIPVAGWMGSVTSTPAGAQFDDYVAILPEGEIGSFGIEGASEEMQAQIVALRDREQPGKYAHFWGTLTCEIPDYGGCQLLVDHLLIDGAGEFLEAEPVAGWTGTIQALVYDEPGAPQPDDAFVLAGPYPVQYGIDAALDASGERELSEAIVSLRDSGAEVTIWGSLTCGVPDAGGCRIEVTRMESGGVVYEMTRG